MCAYEGIPAIAGITGTNVCAHSRRNLYRIVEYIRIRICRIFFLFFYLMYVNILYYK